MFRFCIRDLLWLTTLVAVGVLWQADHRRVMESEAARATLAKRLAKAEALVAKYEAKERADQLWEASRRDPSNLVYFPPLKAGSTPTDASKAAIERIKRIGVGGSGY